MESNWELAVAGSILLTGAFGALISILLEKWSVLKGLWARVHRDAKPLVLLAALFLVSSLPVVLTCIGAPSYILSIMPWVPEPMCSGDNLLFSSVMAVISWTTSQTVFFKLLNGKE